MSSKKDRRHSGRKIDVIYDPVKNPYEETRWDDWNDWRDGMRFADDNTLIRDENSWTAQYNGTKKYNQKNKKLLDRRDARRQSPRNSSNKRFKYR